MKLCSRRSSGNMLTSPAVRRMKKTSATPLSILFLSLFYPLSYPPASLLFSFHPPTPPFGPPNPLINTSTSRVMPSPLPAELVDHIFYLTSDLLTCLNGLNIHSAHRLYQPHIHTYNWAAVHPHGAAAIPFLHRYEILCGTPVAGNPAFATTVAAGLGHLDTVKALLRVRKDLRNSGPLDYACGRGHLEVARYLYAEGMQCTSDAFKWACEAGHVEVLRFLLEISAPIRAAASVHGAVRNGHVQVLRFIQLMGQWPLDEEYKQQQVWGRHLDSWKWHLPASYNGFWEEMLTASLSDEAMMLEETAIAGHVEMVRYLMGDMRDVWDSRVVTIDTAALAGREDVVRVMVEECGARKVFGSTLNALAEEGLTIEQASTRVYLERKRADLIILDKNRNEDWMN